MPTPMLLHPIPVKLRKSDRAFTAAWDENFREPVGQVRRKQRPIELVAQVKNIRVENVVLKEGGKSEHADGYLLFLASDLERRKVTIETGDRIVEIGSGSRTREVDYYVVQVTGRGHYPEHFGHTMIKAFFQDREPSRHRE
jgi:hypothetical protein